MGQSPPGETCNSDEQGTPLLNGPTEFGYRSPTPVQYTTDGRKFAHKGDILFCVRGSTTGRMNIADRTYAIGRGIAAIRHISGYEYIPYLKAIIEAKLPDLLSQSTGSTFPNVSQELLKSLRVPYHSLETQGKIAHILGTLDDKIELNRKMCKTLEEIAQTLFKHWFIDFEFPNEQGKPYKSSGGEMVDSELGPIPKGWRVGTIGDLCTFEYGKALKAEDRVMDDIPVMGSNGQIGWHNEALVKGPGIVVGRKGNPGETTFVWADFWPIDTAFFIKPKLICRDNMYFLFFCLDHANLRLMNSDSAVPGLNRVIAQSHKMIIPHAENTHYFTKHVSGKVESIFKYKYENILLEKVQKYLIGDYLLCH